MNWFVPICFALCLSGCSTSREPWRGQSVDLADLELEYEMGSLIKPGFTELLWATDGFAVIRVGGLGDSTLMSVLALARCSWIVCKAQGRQNYELVAQSLDETQSLVWVRLFNAEDCEGDFEISDWPEMPHEIPRPAPSDWIMNPTFSSLADTQELWEAMLSEYRQARDD